MEGIKTKEQGLIIRQEKLEDYDEIYQLVKTAFETAKVKDGDEQDYVIKLRDAEGYIPELALVAAEKGILVGHIMLTTMQIVCQDNKQTELLLSPICVSLPYRNQGVGGMLIKESFRLAKGMGYSAVFLCGDPEYYKRFGFLPTSEFNIINESEIPQEFVMACELIPDALKNKSGLINII